MNITLVIVMAQFVLQARSAAALTPASTPAKSESIAKPSEYPLEAALVLDGHLAVVDLPSHSLRPLQLPDGLKPEQADLSIDKSKVVVCARKKGGLSRLYLVDVASGGVDELPIPLESDLVSPRFADRGASVLFTAPSHPGPDSLENRDQLYKLTLAGAHLQKIPTNGKLCDFSPVAFGHGKVAYLETSCFIKFALEQVNVATGKEKKLADLTGMRSEFAVSLDGKKLLYTNMEYDGLKLYLLEGTKKPRVLLSTVLNADRLQPRFVCPRDILFVNKHKVWALNSDSGELTQVLDIAAAEAPVWKGGEVAHVER